ncbi:MAG: hypothetical protein K1060chlam4_01590 [Candidatus Anoxychlamydiales bacterium]|nr:hypothetical protein [Candidatus Anoxychlamydiales bacterium]
MPFITPRIDTAPIREAYDEINTDVRDLNNQVRNHNIKTAVKTALFVTFLFSLGMGMFFVSFTLAGLSIPVTTWTSKALIILTFDMVAGFIAGRIIPPKFKKAVQKANYEFKSKINNELASLYKKNSNDIKLSLFEDIEIGYNPTSLLKESSFALAGIGFVEKLKLDSYETVKKRYIDI